MTSEIDNILKGVVTKGINFDEDKRVIGLGTQTITPTQDGPAPLSKQNAFTVEQTLNESIGAEALNNDVSVVPVLPQEEVTKVAEMPVETADLSSLGSINTGIPAEEKLEEHVDNISSGLAPIFDTFESDKKQDAPVGIELPGIDESPLAQEPTGDINMNLFSPIPESITEIAETAPVDPTPADTMTINPTAVEPVSTPVLEPVFDKMTEDVLAVGNNQPELSLTDQTQEDLEIKFMAELNIEAKKIVDIIKSYVDTVVEKKVTEALNERKQNDINNSYIDEGPKMSL